MGSKEISNFKSSELGTDEIKEIPSNKPEVQEAASLPHEIGPQSEAKDLPDSICVSMESTAPDDSEQASQEIESTDASNVPESPEDYHRPYLRKEVKDAIYANAPKDKDGNPLDPNTFGPIMGTPDIGHKPGHEYWREAQKAFKAGLTQSEFNDYMNNPDFYQLENPHNNRSHQYEDHSPLSDSASAQDNTSKTLEEI